MPDQEVQLPSPQAEVQMQGQDATAAEANRFELRIRDLGPSDTRLELRTDSQSREVVARFSAPATPSHESQRREYFTRAPSSRGSEASKVDAGEHSMNALGRALGERLCDSDYALLEFMSRVEAAGVEQLHVVVESDRAEFLAQPWELLILPDSAYVAAATCAGFVRSGLGRAQAPALELDCSRERPLRVLRTADSCDQHLALRWQRSMLRWDGAVQAELLVEPEPQALLGRLAQNSAAAPIHVLHVTASLRGQDPEQVGFATSADAAESIPSAELFAAARTAGVELLLLDLRGAGREPATSAALAAVATAALAAGLGNVVILGSQLLAADSEACFRQLYSQLAFGLPLRLACIETRKALQRQYLEAGQAKTGVRPLQLWSALQHYSQCELRCFASAQTTNDDMPALGRARSSMLGFRSHHLSDFEPTAGDRNAFALFGALQTKTALVIQAERGLGATAAVHESTYALLLAGRIEGALYWNFDDEPYTASDLRQMIASVSALSADAEASELAADLAGRRGLCAFENLDSLFAAERTQADRTEILRLIAALEQAGVLCMVGIRTEGLVQPVCQALDIAPASVQRLAPLSAAEASELVSSLRADSADPMAAVSDIVGCARGNLFLLRTLARITQAELSAFARVRDTSAGDAIASFFSWRWADLPAHWQRLLLLLRSVGDAYFEIWSPVFDAAATRNEGANTDARGSEPGRSIWQALELPPGATYRAALDELTRCGFLVYRGSGRVIDPAARSFLTGVTPQVSPPAAFDLFVCEGVARLSSQRKQQLPRVIADNLIGNRAVWRRYLESAWRAGHYVAAVNTLSPLEQLFAQARLQHEIPVFAESILDQTDTAQLRELDANDSLAWLWMARRALLQAKTPQATALRAGAEHWFERARDSAWRGTVPAALFDQSALFLQQLYDLQRDFANNRALATLACEHYESLGEQRKRRSFTLVLAASEYGLGQADTAERIENALLEELARDTDNGEERPATMLAIATARLRRGDSTGATRIVDSANALDSTAQPAFELLRAELLLVQHDTLAAMQRLCNLWTNALTRRQNIDMNRAIALLQLCVKQLGVTKFEELYAQWAPDCPNPRELGLIPEQLLAV